MFHLLFIIFVAYKFHPPKLSSTFLRKIISYSWCFLRTAQKMKFSIKDFFSKCDQIGSLLRIWSHLLKIYLMENFLPTHHDFSTKTRSRHSSYFTTLLLHAKKNKKLMSHLADFALQTNDPTNSAKLIRHLFYSRCPKRHYLSHPLFLSTCDIRRG